MFSFINRYLPTRYEKKMSALVVIIILLLGVSITARLVDKDQDIRQRASEQNIVTNSITPVIENTNNPTTTIDPLSTSLNVSIALKDTPPPSSPIRTFTVFTKDMDNNIHITTSSYLTYQNGVFKGIFNIPNLPSGTYLFYISTPGFLQNTLNPIPISITKGDQRTFSQISLLPGDLNNDGVINSIDYNTLNECFKDISSCTDEKKEIADLNSDTLINQEDFEILLKNMK